MMSDKEPRIWFIVLDPKGRNMLSTGSKFNAEMAAKAYSENNGGRRFEVVRVREDF